MPHKGTILLHKKINSFCEMQSPIPPSFLSHSCQADLKWIAGGSDSGEGQRDPLLCGSILECKCRKRKGMSQAYSYRKALGVLVCWACWAVCSLTRGLDTVPNTKQETATLIFCSWCQIKPGNVQLCWNRNMEISDGARTSCNKQ